MKPKGKKRDDLHLRAAVVILVLTGVCLFDVGRLWGSPAPDREGPLRVRLFDRSSSAGSTVGRSVSGVASVGRKPSRQPLTPGLPIFHSGPILLDFSDRLPSPAPYDESYSFVSLAPPSDRAPPRSSSY